MAISFLLFVYVIKLLIGASLGAFFRWVAIPWVFKTRLSYEELFKASFIIDLIGMPTAFFIGMLDAGIYGPILFICLDILVGVYVLHDQEGLSIPGLFMVEMIVYLFSMLMIVSWAVIYHGTQILSNQDAMSGYFGF
jgi:hypothetical protein